MGQLNFSLCEFGKAEVCNIRIIIFVHQYIIWFEIAMDYTFCVCIIQSFADQIEQANYFPIGQSIWCIVDSIRESSTANIGHDDINLIIMFAEIIDRDDLWMLKMRNNFHFLCKPFY